MTKWKNTDKMNGLTLDMLKQSFEEKETHPTCIPMKSTQRSSIQLNNIMRSVHCHDRMWSSLVHFDINLNFNTDLVFDTNSSGAKMRDASHLVQSSLLGR